MLIVPDSPYSDSVPIAICTLHIDVLIKIATQEELEKIPDLECATKSSNLHQTMAAGLAATGQQGSMLH